MKIFSINYKLFILFLLIIIPISVLYLDLEINLFDKSKDNVENLSNKFINICGPKNTFAAGSVDNPSSVNYFLDKDKIECANECIGDPNCVIYSTTNQNHCYNIKNISKFTDVPDLCFNCGDFEPEPLLGGADSTNIRGEARFRSDFYQKNKNDINYYNYQKNMADNIINKLNEIKIFPKGDEENKRLQMYQDLSGYLIELTDYLQLDQDHDDTLNAFYDGSYNFIDVSLNDFHYSLSGEINKGVILDLFNRKSKTKQNLEADINDKTLQDNRIYLFYIILIILMIISIIILVVYKFVPNIINDSFIISYFFGVLLLLFFIHNYFKI